MSRTPSRCAQPNMSIQSLAPKRNYEERSRSPSLHTPYQPFDLCTQYHSTPYSTYQGNEPSPSNSFSTKSPSHCLPDLTFQQYPHSQRQHHEDSQSPPHKDMLNGSPQDDPSSIEHTGPVADFHPGELTAQFREGPISRPTACSIYGIDRERYLSRNRRQPLIGALPNKYMLFHMNSLFTGQLTWVTMCSCSLRIVLTSTALPRFP